MKSVIGVMLLSTVLVSWQAEAKAVTSKLSGKLQSSLGQVLKVLESDGAVSVTLYGALSCEAIGIFASSFDPTVSQFFFDAARTGVYTMLFPFGLNIRRLKREMEERDEELDQLQEIIDNIEIEEINREQEVSRELRLEGLQELSKEFLELDSLAEYVEVNDRNDLLKLLLAGLPHVSADFSKLLSNANAIVYQHGGFPLVVARDGLIFNDGVFASYGKMFGDLAFRMQEETEIEEN